MRFQGAVFTDITHSSFLASQPAGRIWPAQLLKFYQLAMRILHAGWPQALQLCPDFAFIALHISIRAQDKGSVPKGDAAEIDRPSVLILEKTYDPDPYYRPHSVVAAFPPQCRNPFAAL